MNRFSFLQLGRGSLAQLNSGSQHLGNAGMLRPLGGTFRYNTILILHTAGHNQFTSETWPSSKRIAVTHDRGDGWLLEAVLSRCTGATVLSCASHERQPNGVPARFPVFQRLPLR